MKAIRQDARKGDDPWSDQQRAHERADYGAVALFYFTRDYRRWREKWPGAERPSLLRVITSVDFAKCMVRAFGYANKPEMRPSHEPYGRVTLGKAPIKRKHEAITAAQLFADEPDEDSDSTPAAPPLSKRAKEREKKKKKAAGDKSPTTKGGGAAGDARKRRDDKGAASGEMAHCFGRRRRSGARPGSSVPRPPPRRVAAPSRLQACSGGTPQARRQVYRGSASSWGSSPSPRRCRHRPRALAVRDPRQRPYHAPHACQRRAGGRLRPSSPPRH